MISGYLCKVRQVEGEREIWQEAFLYTYIGIVVMFW